MVEAVDAISIVIIGHDDKIGGLVKTLSVIGKVPAIAKNSKYKTTAPCVVSALGSWLLPASVDCGLVFWYWLVSIRCRLTSDPSS
jgi:hypothetical protein